MRNRLSLVVAALAGGVVLAPASAVAQGYVSASAGFNFQADSDNSGAFDADFTTGDGVAVPSGTVLASGTSLGWTTEFDSGLFIAAAYGWRLNDAFRIEGEISYRGGDVDTHADVTVGGGSIDAADAAVLITGAAPLGVTVGALVADGQGELTGLGFAVNGYYDIATEGPIGFHLGAGLGFEAVDVEFAPSDTAILDDDDTVFFGQVLAGAGYAVSDSTTLFAGYRYRVSEDVETKLSLLPATLEIENQTHILEFGVRYNF